MRRLAALALVTLAGCGGGGVEYVTRDAEMGFARDALILAARDAEGTRVPLALVRTLDRDLREARTAQPSLASARAVLDYDPHRIQVTVSAEAPWLSAWERGEWRTGEAGIDGVLEPLRPSGVRRFSQNGGQTTYELTFESWIRAKAVAYSLYDKHPTVTRAAVVSSSDPGNVGDLLYLTDPASKSPEFSTSGTIYRRSGGTWVAVPSSAK